MSVLIAREREIRELGVYPPLPLCTPGNTPVVQIELPRATASSKYISSLAPKYLFTFLSSISPQHRLAVLHQPILRTQLELSRFFVPTHLPFLGGFAKLKIKFQIRKFKIQIIFGFPWANTSQGISPRSITSRITVTTYIFDLSGNGNLTSPTPGELSPIWLAVLCFEFHILIVNLFNFNIYPASQYSASSSQFTNQHLGRS